MPYRYRVFGEMMKAKAATQKITFKKIESFTFCPGDLFWEKSSSNKIRIFAAGDLVDINYLQKFKKAEVQLVIDWGINYLYTDSITTLFLQMRNTLGPDLSKLRIEILLFFKKFYWVGNEWGNILTLISICEKSFLEKKVLSSSHFSIGQIRNASFCASLGVFYALVLGYTDYLFLKDFYHLILLSDIALDEKKMTANIWQLIQNQDKEIILKGTEYNSYQTHVVEARQIIKEQFLDVFHDPSILKIIERHHEKCDGSGFPKGLNSHELSDLDSLTIFLTYLPIIFKDEYIESDGKKVTKEVFNSLENWGYSNRLKKIIVCTLDKVVPLDESIKGVA